MAHIPVICQPHEIAICLSHSKCHMTLIYLCLLGGYNKDFTNIINSEQINLLNSFFLCGGHVFFCGLCVSEYEGTQLKFLFANTSFNSEICIDVLAGSRRPRLRFRMGQSNYRPTSARLNDLRRAVEYISPKELSFIQL
jgi:hypothetical protein